MKRAAYALLTVIGFGLCGIVCQRVASRGRFVASYSTYGAGPSGTRALYTLLTELGVPARRWSEDLSALPPDGMLVAFGGCDSGMARRLSRYESEELERWIGAGGTLFVAGARGYLPPEFGIGFDHSVEQCIDGWRLRADEPEEKTEQDGDEDDDGTTLEWTVPLSPPLEGLDDVPLDQPGTLLIDPYTNHTTLLGVGEQVHATVMERGRGRVIWFSSASLFQNRDLLPAGGAVIFARLVDAYAPRGPITFDEYHLGVGEKRSLMAYLRRVGAFPVAFLLLSAVLMWLWRGGARFGAVRQDDLPPPLGTASYVASMASLYGRAKDPRGVGQVLLRQGLRMVAKQHRIQVAHDDAEAARLAGALRAVGQQAAAAEVERMVQAVQRPRALSAVAQEIDDAARSAIAVTEPN